MKCEVLHNSMTQLTTKAGPGKILPTSHHYFMNFLDKEKVQDIVRICDPSDQGIRQGKTVYGSNPNIIDYKYTTFFEDAVPHSNEIIETVLKKNEELFRLNIDKMMKFQYIIYDKDSHFEWHPDGPFSFNLGEGFELPEDVTYRKLTLVMMLTPHEEYQGGEFQLFEPQTHPANALMSFKMDAGEAILFPSFMMHKVAPVQSGQRRTLVAWFCGPRWT